MEALEIEGQAHQEPFAGDGVHAAQRELPEAAHLRDDAEHGLDRLLARAVHRFAHGGFELVGHLDLGAGVLRRRIIATRGGRRPSLLLNRPGPRYESA